MRDLLTELVRRTLRPELTVQPRLPSRYEPRDGVREPAVDSSEDDAPRRTSVRAAQREDAAGQFAGAAPPAARDSRQSEGMREIPSNSTAATASVVATPNHTAQAPVAHPLADRVSTPGEPPTSVMAARARDAAPGSTPTPPPHRQAPSGLSLPFVRPILVAAREPAPVAAAVRPATPPGVAGDPAGPPHAAATPEIHISIGRIDVRAAVANAAPRRADRHAGPTQSLNEYLDVRARRGRR